MIKIETNRYRNLELLANAHYKSHSSILDRRIKNTSPRVWLKKFLQNNIEEIITAKPDKLHSINIQFNKELKASKQDQTSVYNILNKIFNYDVFIKDKTKTYDFAKNIGVDCCPYCNRNYTITVIGENKTRIIRPDFDHFFPQSKYPLLALSFFNLIPSCPLCNRSVKRDKTLVYQKFIHPYEEGFDDTLKFNYEISDIESGLGLDSNITITPLINNHHSLKAERCKESYKVFKLGDIYNASHKPEIVDLIRKHHISGGRYLEILHSSFKNIGSLEDLYKIAFGYSGKDEDYDKKPLSKLTKDIVEQLQFTMPKL